MPLSAEFWQPWLAGLLDLALALHIGAWVLHRHVPGGMPRLVFPLSLGLLAAGLTGLLWSEAASMGGVAMNEALPSIAIVLAQTGFGQMCLLAALAWCGLLVTCWFRHRVTAWIGLAVFLCARAAMGHAMDSGWNSYAIWIHGLHIAAGATWLGTVLLAAGLMHSHWNPEQRADFARYLSRVATLALIVVAASGVTDAWRMLAPSGISFDDTYTRLLGAKLACVGLAVIMGAWNRWGVMPRLAHDANAASRFVQVLVVEGVVLLAAMLLAAQLGVSMPPMAS